MLRTATLHLAACLALVACRATSDGALRPSHTAEVEVELGLTLPAGEASHDFTVAVPLTGRYRCEVTLVAPDGTEVWVEDHIGNPDGRTYDITGPIAVAPVIGTQVVARDGSPLDAGAHAMRVHTRGAACLVESVRFVLLRPHVETPTSLTQGTTGTEWKLVWADEFDGSGLPDPKKWTHDLGNWGWGNRELQYYTDGRVENARQEGGHLVIEARPNDLGHPWTSARLTTRGKISFLYGRIEIRAKAPATDGTWAAGWTLGDAYRDERSWPYCGEIDICEAVGREIDDVTGDGRNHASCHTRAYYFKQGNHISNTIPVAGMSTQFHDYVCEWDERSVRMFVDGVHYYTYDKTADALEWPFNAPQNLILNLAMGGGMGQAVAPGAGSQRFVIDHVRIYGRR